MIFRGRCSEGARFGTLLLCLFLPGILRAAVGELIVRGDALDEKNRNGEALAIYLEADRLKPGDAEILHRVAKQYAQLMTETTSTAKQKELGAKALDAAERAVRAGPQNAQAHLSLAIVYGRIAFLQPARRKIELSKRIRDEAETAARLDPREDYAWHVLARWNYEMANFNPFLKALAQAIYGKFPDASNEKAAEYFQRAIAIAPRQVAHRVEYGRTLLALGRKDEARRELQKGLALPSTAKDDEETKQRARKALATLP